MSNRPSSPASVLIVDPNDNVSLRAALLGAARELNILAMVDKIHKAAAAYFRLKPDVVLLDYESNLDDGITAVKTIYEGDPNASIIVLMDRVNPSAMATAITAGARGICMTNTSTKRIRLGIEFVMTGEIWLDEVLLQPLVEGSLSTEIQVSSRPQVKIKGLLTAKETAVLSLVAQGYSNRNIADELFISRETVKTHIDRIMRRLNARDRTDAAVKAVRLNLL